MSEWKDASTPPERAGMYRVIRRGKGGMRREDRAQWILRDGEWAWRNSCGLKITSVEQWKEYGPEVGT